MKTRLLLSTVSILTLASALLVGCSAGAPSADDESASTLTRGKADAGTSVTPAVPPANGAEVHTRVLRDATTEVVLSLNEKTVFCTAQGYGQTVLKVSVPDLDWLARSDATRRTGQRRRSGSARLGQRRGRPRVGRARPLARH